nr:unnamed protein product [Digitaria exilis]
MQLPPPVPVAFPFSDVAPTRRLPHRTPSLPFTSLSPPSVPSALSLSHSRRLPYRTLFLLFHLAVVAVRPSLPPLFLLSRRPAQIRCKQGLPLRFFHFHIALFLSSLDLLLRRRRLSEQHCSGRSATPSPCRLPSMVCPNLTFPSCCVK